MIKLMLNLLWAQSGIIKLFGLDNVKDETAIKQQIGFVLDDTYLHEKMTIKQVGWLVSGFYHDWDDTLFRQYMKKFNLPEGMKAKLSLAVALSHNAKLLILDEPTSGLDPVVRNDILSELLQTVKDFSTAILKGKEL